MYVAMLKILFRYLCLMKFILYWTIVNARKAGRRTTYFVRMSVKGIWKQKQ